MQTRFHKSDTMSYLFGSFSFDDTACMQLRVMITEATDAMKQLTIATDTTTLGRITFLKVEVSLPSVYM